MSEFQVYSRELFKMPERTPAPNGCLDPRLGVSDKTSTCNTCRYVLSLRLSSCFGLKSDSSGQRQLRDRLTGLM